MMTAKNRRTCCCCNIGRPPRVRLVLQLKLLQLLSLSQCACALLLVLAIMATSALDKKMQVEAFVVAPPLAVLPRTNHPQKSSSSSSSSSSPSSSHLLVVFGSFLPMETHCHEKGVGPEEAARMSGRRSLITALISAAAAATILASSPLVAEAAMENTQTTFKVGEAIGVDAAKARLVEARESLQYLVDNYDDIVKKGGGDNVRRYLGTVGTSSGLYGISKVLKALQEEADDIVEYTELCNDFEQALRDADTACYSAIFVEFSAAKTKPEKFFADAKGDVGRMQKYFKVLTAELNL